MLPRKAVAQERLGDGLRNLAFQAGVLVAVERNRKRMTQGELANTVGSKQPHISDLENGWPVRHLTDRQIDRVFTTLGLGRGSLGANYVKWWRDNSPL